MKTLPEMYDALAVENAKLRAENEALKAELRFIVNARRFDRSHFENDYEFASWAQSRARNALAANEDV